MAVAVLCVLAAALPGTVTAGESGPDEGQGSPAVRIVAVYPNPVANGDAGEFVVLRARRPVSLGNWSLADDETSVSLPNVTVEGRVVLSTAPERTRNLTAGPVHRLPDDLALANAGERIRLRDGERVVDRLGYEDAPEGEVLHVSESRTEWHPAGATDRPVVTARGGQVRTFVLPDRAAVPDETLAGAERRILVAGYTLTSERVVERLRAARRRGVRVRVLVDDAPVGGLTRREARALDRLAAANVSVAVLGGERARYAFHHAKYAVVDDRALVATENWKPAGTGGHASRGWGAVVTNDRIVGALAATFRTDASAHDATPWPVYRAGQTFAPADTPPANRTYPSRFDSGRVAVREVELLVAPDNAERRLVELLDSAEESIRVQQVSIGSRHQPFLRATLRAARRGVQVRILLSRAWYVREENRALVRWLDRRAEREDLPLDAKLARPRGRFEKIHAKGVLVDGEHAVVGSMNWNNHSARENREVLVLLSGADVAGYYRRVFRADWRGGIWQFPVGVGLAVGVGLLLAGLVARRIEFETMD